MELCDIYYGFLEGMKKISVGVCLNEYTWLEICEKEKWIVQEKTKWKKKLKKKCSWTKAKRKKNEERKEVEVPFKLYCKVSGIGIIWKEKLCSTSL